MNARVKKGEAVPATLDILALGNQFTGSEKQAAEIRSQYTAKQGKDAPSMRATVGEDDALRRRILQVSLFPGIYSK